MEFEYLIIFLPLVAAIISGFFGKFLGSRNSEILTSLFVSISSIFSFLIFYKVFNDGYINNLDISNPTITITVVAKPNSGSDSVDLHLFQDILQENDSYYIKNRINDWVYYIDPITSSSILKYPSDLIQIEESES